MAVGPKLELRHGQQLVMTPQLQQAIRLLQLSNLELTAFVDAELERNPLLERDDSDGVSIRTETAESQKEGLERADTSETWGDLPGPAADARDTLDTDIDNLYPDTPRNELESGAVDLGSWANVRQTTGSGGGDDDHNLEAFVAGEHSLREHLIEQLQVTIADPVERMVGQYLIDLVDEAGYVASDAEAVAERLGCPLEQVLAVLGVLQTFDPPGVCARSLAECLALQLKDRNRYDPQIGALLDNLDLLASHNLPRLRKLVGCDMDELREMIAELKQLSPKPGLAFGSLQIQPVVPDVIVRPASDGSYIVELNSETLPRVLVNRSYYTRVCKSTRRPEEKGYLVDCLQTANWLAKSLDQRARTILRVSEEIVRQQDAFFAHGVRHLRPLNLRAVADAISMHESTVSRVTSNKYMSTPRGIFELKYFFTSAIAASGEGEAHSSESVRHRIREMIEGESMASVLSDDTIVDRLRAEGIDIARRTVAKYREGMRIPSSVLRRREKQLRMQGAKTA